MKSGDGDGDANVVIGVCSSDARTALWVRAALRGHGVVREFPTFAELLSAIQSGSPSMNAVVVSPRDRAGADGTVVVRALARNFPDVASVAHCTGGAEQSTVVRELAVAGVHELLFGVEDSRIVVRAAIERARRQCAADRVLADFAPVVNARLVPLLEACLFRPGEVKDVATLRRSVGLHRKTLYNRCLRGGLTGPGELIGWCRVGLAAYLLGRTERTVESLAIEMQFKSPNALRNLLKRYTGCRATEIRAAGGLSVVVEALRRRIHERLAGLHLT